MAKKFDTNSNLYIIVYATVMVVIVAVLLAVAALSLQERQYANELNEKKQSILQSLGAQDRDYDEFIEAYVLDAKGQRIDVLDAKGQRINVLDAEGQRIKNQYVFALLKDLPGAFAAGKFPVFEAADGRVVLPVTGTGLWGPIWGYVALEKDMDTVAGIIMAHKGETPGLGAEIATEKYQQKFVGKTIFEGDEFRSISLVKGGARDDAHGVDAISGGTKTSDGVTAMLRTSLEHYLPMLRAARTAEAVPAAEPTDDEAADEAQEMSNDENVENNE